jgi:hypothetical protein
MPKSIKKAKGIVGLFFMPKSIKKAKGIVGLFFMPLIYGQILFIGFLVCRVR